MKEIKPKQDAIQTQQLENNKEIKTASIQKKKYFINVREKYER